MQESIKELEKIVGMAALVEQQRTALAVLDQRIKDFEEKKALL